MAKKQRALTKRRIRDIARPYLFLSPSLISIFILGLLPMIYTIYISFTNFNLNHLQNYHVIGITNYISVFKGPFASLFFPVLGWTIVSSVVMTFGCFIIGLIAAMLLNNPNMKEASFYKSLLILPWALPATIATIAWKFLYDMNYGSVNVVLKSLHIITNSIPWLTDPTWARIGILIASVWLGFPYMMNICIGALSAIPIDYYEAAEIDGASKWQKFTKITLPSITSASLPLLITSFAFNFNNMGAAYLITLGNPPRTTTQFAGYTDILATAVYKLSMVNYKYEVGAAISVVLFLIIGTISVVNFKFTGAFKEID